MRPRKPTLPPISPAFAAKKDAILSSLAQPDDSYSDASPKGSVDDAIKELIDRLNTIDGVVTTSSCAGRVSVFAEGRRNRNNSILAAVVAPRQTKVNGMNHVDGAAQPGQASERDESDDKQRGVPGGKGLGGQWLFVSHEPLGNGMNGDEIAQMFGLPTKRAETNAFGSSVGSQRLVRFQFEPMILHVMCASLHHAQPILTAAINAGFRESGVQSLKNLDDANSFPMVAVRSSGLAFESLVGYVDDSRDEEKVQRIVDNGALELLATVANDRFVVNRERISRFEEELFRDPGRLNHNERPEDRAVRKRAQGLERQAELVKANESHNMIEVNDQLVT